MTGCNQTKITEFILVGFETSQNEKNTLFCLFLTIYSMSLIGNLLIIGLILGSESLQSPMYFFLSHLSLCDIFLSTSVVPILLCTFISNGKIMSVPGCALQYFATGTLTAVECYLLTVMSYDRYLAICNPLQYIIIMSIRLRRHLVTWTWLLGIIIGLMFVLVISYLGFCGYNVINYVYCDFPPLIEASCSDTFIVQILAMTLTIPVAVFPFIFILITYFSIILAILKISTTSRRQKAFSTCTSHLTVVCTYYGILIAKYMVPSKGQSLNINKVISMLYTAVTPLLNPIIYSLRNQEIIKTLNILIFENNKNEFIL